MNPVHYQEELRKLMASVKSALDRIIDDYGLRRRNIKSTDNPHQASPDSADPAPPDHLS